MGREARLHRGQEQVAVAFYRKLLAGLVSLAVITAFAAAVVLVGPSWKERRTRRFVKTIERHAELEYGYRFHPRPVKR